MTETALIWWSKGPGRFSVRRVDDGIPSAGKPASFLCSNYAMPLRVNVASDCAVDATGHSMPASAYSGTDRCRAAVYPRPGLPQLQCC